MQYVSRDGSLLSSRVRVAELSQRRPIYASSHLAQAARSTINGTPSTLTLKGEASGDTAAIYEQRIQGYPWTKPGEEAVCMLSQAQHRGNSYTSAQTLLWQASSSATTTACKG